MPDVRPLHVALALSAALTCLMVGVLVGIAAGGGHVSHALNVIRGAPPVARASTRPAAAVTLTTTVARLGRARSRTVTVTRAAPATTVTQPASTVTVSAPASTVTETVTQPGSSAGSSTAP